LGRSVCVALPGNPAAAATCFLRFVRPLLLARAGAGWHLPRGRVLPAGFRMNKKPGRAELPRCRLAGPHDRTALVPVARQGSAIFSTLLEADGIVELDADLAAVAPGDPLVFLSWRDLGIG
jgi:molybdopterin biosynthesis enzyme